MADNKLMFPIGFDLDKAVKEAGKLWKSTYNKQLSDALSAKPVKVGIEFDLKKKDLNNLSSVKEELAKIKLKPITPQTKKAIESLVKELKTLAKILKKIDTLNAANARSTASASAATALAAQRTARANEINQRAAARAKQDAERLAILEERKRQAILRTVQAQQRAAAATRKVSSAYKEQDSYISRLIKRTAVLFSIATVVNFIKKIREVTAEFELQRVSLGAIIQDTNKANALFQQIKAFAVKSPFEIKDLVSYTKQLAAYNIKADELFDTMKRLADVSAGLGVDMQRVILAYGQVKAASVLRGTELRQFTEAGIPLVQQLADKFTQLRGRMVSTAEVFDLISKRAVSFEMVKEIFEDMTNAGGMFYEMQEKQSATLAGQWSNLKDAYSIMLDEIGNTAGVRSSMEGLIEALKILMDHWQGAYSFIGGAAVALFTYNKTMNTTARSVEKNIRAEKALEEQRVRAGAVGRQLTAFEKDYLRLNKQLSAVDYKRIITEGQLSQIQLVRLARQSRTNKEIENGIIQSKALNAQQIKQIQSAKWLNYQWGVMKMRLAALGDAMKNFGRTLLASWPVAVITAIVSLISDYSQHLKAHDEALEKNRKEYEEYEKTLKRIENAYLHAKEAAEMAKSADDEFAKAAYGDKIKQLQEIAKLLEVFGLKNTIDFSVVNADNIDPVIEAWLKKLNEVNASTKRIGDTVADIATAYQANVMGWSLWGDNLNTDMKDFARAWRRLQSNKDFSSELDRMRLYVDEMSIKSKDFYKHLSDAVGEDAKLALSAKRRNESDVEYWQRIMKNYEKIKGEAGKQFSFSKNFKIFGDILAKDNFELALKEVMHEFEEIRDELEGQEPLEAKMTIDKIFLQNQWDDTLKEWFIMEANKKWNLNIPVTFTLENAEQVNTGIKSIIQHEFPGLFTSEELKNLTTASELVEAIDKKRDETLKKLKLANKLQNNSNDTARKNVETIKNLNEELAKEQAKTEVDRDDSRIQTLRAEILALQEQNKVYDEQIKKEKELAESEAKRADEAYKRVASEPLSTVAEDVKETFPQMVADAIKAATDKDYPVGLLISEDDLEKIKDIGDLYDKWVESNKKIKEEEEKIKDLHVSDAAIERERAELTERQKKASEEIKKVEKEISESKYKDQKAQLDTLRYNIMAATTAEAKAKAQKEYLDFINKESNAAFAMLILRQEELKAILTKKQVQGEITNEALDDYKKELEAQKKFNKAMAERYGFKMPDDDKNKGRGEDPWILLMKNRMKFMQDFQKGVENLSKFLEKNNALMQEQNIMLFRGKSLDIDVSELEGSQKELEDWFDDAIEQVSKKIKKMGGKMWDGLGVKAILSKDTKSRVIKAYQELLQELFNQKTDFQTNKLKESMEKELKDLSSQIAKTKTAKDFFDKMLNITGDKKFTADITMSVYGETGDDLLENMKKSIEKQFAGIDVSLAIDMVNGIINYDELDKIYEIYKDKIPENYHQGIEKMIADGKKQNAENIKMWTEQLAKVKSFEQRKTDIIDKETQRRNEIIKSNMPEEEKQQLINLSYDSQKKQLDEVNMDAFKASEDYIKIFEKLDYVSSSTIQRLIQRLKDLIAASQALGQEGTEGMKTLVNALNKLEEEATKRDPVKGMVDSLKEYIAARKALPKAEAELDKEYKNFEAQSPALDQNIQQAKMAEIAAQQELNKAQEYYNLLLKYQDQIIADGGDPATVQMEVVNAKQQVTQAELEQNNAAAKTAKAEEKKAQAVERLQRAEKKVTDLQDDQKSAGTKFQKSMNEAANFASALANTLSTVVDLLGESEDSEIGAAFQGAIDALNGMASMITTITVLMVAFNAVCASNPILAIATGVLAIGNALFGFISARKVKKANKEIEKQQTILDNLERSYDKLKDAMDTVFGNERTQNFQDQQRNLRAQITATQKQLEAEKSKGKKKDKEKIKQYEENIKDLQDQMDELRASYAESFLGTDLAGAARTFAESWLEAYKEFGDTRKALEESMQEMMENLVTEAVLGAVAQSALKPVFDYITSLQDDTSAWTDPNTWRKIAELSSTSLDNLDNGLNLYGQYMEQFGMIGRELGSDMTGISKDIATASEESILGLAAGINTQNFYISHIDGSVSQILSIMQGGGSEFSSGEQISDLVTIQNQHLSYLPNIAQNTAETVKRAERAAIACEEIASSLGRVVTPRGVKGAYQLNVSI